MHYFSVQTASVESMEAVLSKWDYLDQPDIGDRWDSKALRQHTQDQLRDLRNPEDTPEPHYYDPDWD